MAAKLKVGIVGATGMVGQRFITLLQNHPWFEIAAVSASARSAGKPYAQSVAGRWAMTESFSPKIGEMMVGEGSDIKWMADQVDLVFCAVDMPKEDTRKLEDAYALAETPVISSNSAHRHTPDVPMFMPEINPHHMNVIEAQRARLGTRQGFIAVKPNCSIQSYVPALHPLLSFAPTQVSVCTYQAISGAGKTFDTFPEMVDNVIPFIGGEEEKSELEPLKIWGELQNGKIIPVTAPQFSAQCIRVPVTDGHLAAVSVKFERSPDKQAILDAWKSFEGLPQQRKLPSAPTPFLRYFEEDDRPQTRLDREAGHGMAVTIGRLRPDTLFDWKFVALSHNTLRGAAGGSVLTAEMLVDQGYIVKK